MADPVLVRGIVVDNNDPQNRGRVKIRIPSYHVLQIQHQNGLMITIYHGQCLVYLQMQEMT